jgi:copper transport protein
VTNMKLRLFTVIVVLLILLAAATPVLAHALLLRSIPAENATLDRAPAQIELFFSETLEPSFSSISVLDSNGLSVDNADSKVDSADSTHLTVSLRSLPDGIYTVAWKALSAVDGHVTTGAFPFAVGNVDAAALAAAEQATRQVKLSLGEIIAKWLLYLAAMALTGGTLFILIIWQPAYAALQSESEAAFDETLWERLARLALIGLGLASILGLLVQAGQAAGSEIAAPWSPATGQILFSTRYGVLWLARFVLLLILVTTLLEMKSRRARWLSFGISLLLLLTISLGSHAAAEPKPVWPVLGDWIHLVAASIWVGGLTHFVAGIWTVRRLSPATRTHLTSELIPRFSILALLSVNVIILSGIYSAYLRIGSLEAFVNSLYGQALIVKILIALPMVALGAINLLVITPRIKRESIQANAPARVADRFRGIVLTEISLGVALVLSVSVFTSIPPARITSTAPALTASAQADDLKIDLDITPGRVGLNTFTLKLTANGQPVDETKEVALRFTPTKVNVPPSEVQLIASGGGVYSAKGAYLSLPDTWQVQAVVRREGQFDSFANFNFVVGTTSTGASLPWERVGGGALLLAAFVYLAALQPLKGTPARRVAVSYLPAAALFIAGAFVFLRSSSPSSPAGLVNPIPPNADSIAKGQALYTANCVPCHGAGGKGDGPVGLTLNPRPADLTLHAIPGVHTDGQLYEWITNGYPNSVMPAFKQRLSDDDRWNLLNFIRTMAPKGN